jgi:ABC-type transporter Mla subunit MlaD
MDAVSKRLNTVTDTLNGQLRQFESLCQSLKTMTTAATDLVTKSRTSTTTATPTDDRSANIIVFGLTEDRNSSVWNAVLSNSLEHVAGRSVEITDAFRIGK